MAAPGDFVKFVPGFEFLQGLVKNAGAALPGMGQWIAPTLDPAELDKRIDQLKTVQFWLEQNARMIAATIQALEVQRMTLSTLKSMNLPMAEVAEAFKARVPEAAPAAAPPSPLAAKKRSGERAAAPPAQGPAASAGVIDPMKWWSALTDQFTQLATKAMQDVRTSSASAGAAASPSAVRAKPAAAAPRPKRPSKKSNRKG
jgi:hypothetical protein